MVIEERVTRLLIAAAIVTLFVLAPCCSGLSAPEISGGEPDIEYPNGYTHRPLISLYTSLSCPGCMDNADPAVSQYWSEFGYAQGAPVSLIIFHLHAGGNRDDSLYNEEGDAWADHQQILGTPTFLVDGGYRYPSTTYTSLKESVDEAGDWGNGGTGFLGLRPEPFKVTEARVSSVYENGTFKVKASVSYVESQGTTPLDDQSLSALIKVAMVEDNVIAYSSYNAGEGREEYVNCHNAFRGWAGSGSATMSPGQEWSGEFTWTIPELDPEEDNVVAINPVNVHPVLVVYDEDDTSSGGAEGYPAATRAINSATPVSTAYDLSNTAPTIEEPAGSYRDGKVRISATLDDSDSLYRAYVAYNMNAPNYTGPWSMAEMTITGEGPYQATASIDSKEGQSVYYMIIAYDGEWAESKSQVSSYKAASSGGPLGGGGVDMGAVGGFLLILVIVGVVYYLGRQGKLPASVSKHLGWKPEPGTEGDESPPEEGGTVEEDATPPVEPPEG